MLFSQVWIKTMTSRDIETNTCSPSSSVSKSRYINCCWKLFSRYFIIGTFLPICKPLSSHLRSLWERILRRSVQITSFGRHRRRVVIGAEEWRVIRRGWCFGGGWRWSFEKSSSLPCRKTRGLLKLCTKCVPALQLIIIRGYRTLCSKLCFIKKFFETVFPDFIHT